MTEPTPDATLIALLAAHDLALVRLRGRWRLGDHDLGATPPTPLLVVATLAGMLRHARHEIGELVNGLSPFDAIRQQRRPVPTTDAGALAAVEAHAGLLAALATRGVPVAYDGAGTWWFGEGYSEPVAHLNQATAAQALHALAAKWREASEETIPLDEQVRHAKVADALDGLSQRVAVGEFARKEGST